jgi:probable rRNA maturation factor
MITVQVNQAIALQVDEILLIQAAQQALLSANVDRESELSIVLENDLFLQQLNHRYLGINAPTDVLSFPAGHIDPDTNSVYLGDVIISVPRAQSQATAGNHSLADELQLLVVHGVLHLIGFDHVGDEDKKNMQATQDAILKQLGVKVKASS